MKTTIKYSVKQGLMTYKTWKQAVEFANRIGISTIIVKGKRGSKECEFAYSIDTWKNAKQIAFDVECELS
jgi:hypothetical protein